MIAIRLSNMSHCCTSAVNLAVNLAAEIGEFINNLDCVACSLDGARYWGRIRDGVYFGFGPVYFQSEVLCLLIHDIQC